MPTRSYQPGDASGIHDLLFGTHAAGDLPGYARADLTGVLERLPGAPQETILFVDGARILGFYQPHYPLLVVHRDTRRQGIGRVLVDRAQVWAVERGEDELWLAPPAGSTVADAFCRALGFRYRFSFYGMRLTPEVPVPPPIFPDDVATRSFSPEIEDAYVALINAAFAGHQSPVVVSAEQIRQSHTLPGRGPDGVLILTPHAEPARPIGYCRTLVAPSDDGGSATIGQIGLLPEWRGRGLGRELLRWGIARLRDVAPGPIDLGVEAENTAALALYERTGFRRSAEWPRWSRWVSLTP